LLRTKSIPDSLDTAVSFTSTVPHTEHASNPHLIVFCLCLYNDAVNY
jgi:hypothetical protein